MIEFVIPLKIDGKLGLNSLYSTNKHWAKRKNEADIVHFVVKGALIAGKVPRVLYDSPVTVELSYNSRLDIDNHGYVAKLIIDGLKGYLIADDSKKYVTKLTQQYWSGQGVKVKIDVME